MPHIHLIERITNVKISNKDLNEWDSYSWKISEETAKKLVGGKIYLHKAQDKPSHFGGEILSYKILGEDDGDIAGRVVFKFRASADCKGISAGKDGWGMEKKIIW